MFDHLQVIAKYLVIPLVGLLAAYFLTPLVMKFAKAVGMVDRPDERRIHKGVIPRGGGLAVVISFHAACAAIYFLPWQPFENTLSVTWWLGFLPSSIFLTIVGQIDDRWGMSPRVKLGCQVIAALGLYAGQLSFGNLFSTRLPMFLDVCLVVFWCVGFVNAFNLIDGLDGLASGLSAIAAAGMAGAFVLRHMPGDSLVMLGLLGACLGFLRYNFNPARVFLGDTGSMFLGFTLAAASLCTNSKNAAVTTLAVPLLAAGVPIFDTILAIWRRSARRIRLSFEGRVNGNSKMFEADKDHLHHRLLRSLLSQRRVATMLYVTAAAMMSVGLLSIAFHSWSLTIYLVAFVAAVYLIVRHIVQVELWDSGLALVRGLQRPSARTLAVIAFPLADVAIFALALILTVSVAHETSTIPFRILWLSHVPIWIGIPFLFLVASRTYGRLWTRARPAEFFMLIVALAGGALVSSALDIHMCMGVAPSPLYEAYLFWSLTGIAITGMRLVPCVVRDVLPLLLRRSSIPGVETIPTLVYGAGSNCTLFLKAKTMFAEQRLPMRNVIGLLDDNEALAGCTVHGYRVLGGVGKLNELITAHGIREIVTTVDLTDDTWVRLLEVVDRRDVAVFCWQSETKAQGIDDLLRQETGPKDSRGPALNGMAHEINNPLNGIINYAQLIRERMDGSSPLHEYSGEILRESERIAATVRQFMDFKQPCVTAAAMAATAAAAERRAAELSAATSRKDPDNG